MVIIKDTEYEIEAGVINRYTPMIVNKSCLFTGSMSFAFFEEWKEAIPEKHNIAKIKSIDNAIEVLDIIKKEFLELKSKLEES